MIASVLLASWKIPSSDSMASVFAGKLDSDGWAPLNDSITFSTGFTVGASGNKLGIELVPHLTLSLMQS